MNKNKRGAVFFILVSALFLQSCDHESPLSSGKVVDPSLLRVRFAVEKTKTESEGSSEYLFQAVLLDSKERFVELSNGGGVYLNGIKMFAQKFPPENMPRYRLYTDDIKFRLDSLYTFTVVLSDGQAYPSYVRTPVADLFTSSAFVRNDSAVFNWTVNNTDSIRVSYALRYADGTSGSSFVKTAGPTGKNEAAFPGAKGYGAVSFGYTLSVFRQGIVNPGFRAGSWARSTIALEHK
jgi:hypothetical protein